MSQAPVGRAQICAWSAIALRQIIESEQTFDQLRSAAPDRFIHRSFTATLYGALRHYVRLTAIVDGRLKKRPRQKDSNLYFLLIVGAYQLTIEGTPRHAVVNECVHACTLLKRTWAKGLVNATLRSIPEGTQLDNTEHSLEFPEWLRMRLAEQYPNAETLFAASLARPPMTLRVNRTRTAPETYRQQLRDAGIGFATTALSATLVLDEPQPSRTLPGWQAGWVAVQDLGAQRVAQAFLDHLPTGPAPVLDACAAPGGKAFYCLEADPDQRILALETNPARLATMHALAARLYGEPQSDRLLTVEGDATRDDWWDGEAFKAILLDAPCSGTGTIRRHPEIRLRLSEADLDRYADLQLEMLRRLWPKLAPGGSLLYCTCSIMAEENDRVVDAFLKEEFPLTARPVVQPLSLPTGRRTHHGWQLLPTDPQTDGFYLSLLLKPEPSNDGNRIPARSAAGIGASE